MSSGGDSKVDAKAMSKAISDGDGEALAIVIKETLADGDEQSVTEGNCCISHGQADGRQKLLQFKLKHSAKTLLE